MMRWIPLCGLILVLAMAKAASAEGNQDSYNDTSVGFMLDGGNGDFSTGIGVTSPWFFGSSLALQAAAMQSWYMHGVDSATGEEDWKPYTSYKLGLMGGGTTVSGFMRMYGAGGLLYILPNRAVSEKKSVTGSYGAFGFEFLSGRSLNYYIELGTKGIAANADKLPGKPLYGNGFSSTVGFRYYL